MASKQLGCRLIAGIQDLNIVKYTSVIPPESEPISLEDAKPFLRHGAVQESIMAVMHGVKGDRITAGVGRVQVRSPLVSRLLQSDPRIAVGKLRIIHLFQVSKYMLADSEKEGQVSYRRICGRVRGSCNGGSGEEDTEGGLDSDIQETVR